MKKLLLGIMLSFSMLTMVAQQIEWPAAAKAVFSKKAEIYFKTALETPDDINLLTGKMTIDKTNASASEVYIYANRKGFEYFLTLGLPYEILPAPGDSFGNLKMYAGGKDDFPWDAYPTHEAYVAKMYKFATDHPDICQVFSIGQSVDGREILMAKISDNVATKEAEPQFLYTGQMHGDEIVAYMMFLHLIDEIVENYGTDPQITRLVNEMEIWINPLSNPDGTYTTDNSNLNGATRANANGVDLNRNYPGPVGGPHPDGEAYQPETILFMQLAEDNNFVMSSNSHSGTEVVNYPWDSWRTNYHADNDWWKLISHEYADTVQYYAGSYPYFDGFNDGVTHGGSWYVVHGGRQDYMNYYHNCRELTLELSDNKALPASQLVDHWNYNRNAMLNYIEQASYGFRGQVTDAETGEPIVAKVELLNHDKDNSFVISDADFGMYYRPVLAGTYDIKISADCYDSVLIENVSIDNYQVVENNVALNMIGEFHAQFMAVDTLIAVGASIEYSSTSCQTPDTYAWTFEGGTPATSTDPNPTVTYANEGIFSTTLTVTKDGVSQTFTRTDYIQVAAPLVITNGEQETCNAIFLDSGGETGSYGNNENKVMTLKADASSSNVSSLNVTFIEFDVEYNSSCTYDYLEVYDGTSTSAPLIGKYCGTDLPGPFKSTNADHALTFKFHSDIASTGSGWKAAVRCHHFDNIAEMAKETALRIYPNPAQGILNIEAKEEIAQLELVNINGQVVLTTQPKAQQLVLDIHDVNAGMYFVKIYTSNGTAIRKLAIQ